MILSAAVVAGQGLICGLTAAGWGYWVFRLCGRPVDRAGTFGLLCALGGWCAGILLLQDLLPCDARLQWTAPLAGAVALAGLIAWWRDSPALPRYRLSWAPIVLTAAIYLFQSAGLIEAGPRDYYGYARQDQSNYVMLSEFLVEKPFSTSLADVGLHPWLIKGVETKTERIGQCVANGYLSGVTGRDASYTYGAVSVFFVALVAAAVWGCLLAFGVPPLVAGLAAAWAGALPALTTVHLEGFFSQTCTVFCFVALPWTMRLAAQRFWPAIALAVLLLGLLLCTYSEEYLVGLALTGALLVPLYSLGIGRFLGAAAAGLLGPWLVSVPVAENLWRFAQRQTAAATKGYLAELQPRAGSWRGWNELFVAAPGHQPVLLALAAAAGFGILAAAIGAAVAPETDRIARTQRAVLAIVPAGVLAAAVLATRPVFPFYVFGKLSISFAPLVVVLVGLAAAGWARPRAGSCVALGLLVLIAAWSSWTKLAVVFHDGAGLATMNLPQARQVYRELDAHPERTYLLAVSHGTLNGWFAYHARHAAAYSLYPIGDVAQDPHAFLYLAPPPRDAEVWDVAWDRMQRRAP